MWGPSGAEQVEQQGTGDPVRVFTTSFPRVVCEPTPPCLYQGACEFISILLLLHCSHSHLPPSVLLYYTTLPCSAAQSDVPVGRPRNTSTLEARS